jgi:hypothetical protein
MGDKGLYDKDSAADYLSTSDRRVAELRRSGALTSVRDGREWKYRPSDLDANIDSLPEYERADDADQTTVEPPRRWCAE